jgi:hypothetical protein
MEGKINHKQSVELKLCESSSMGVGGWTDLEIMTVTGENVQRVEGDRLKVGQI